MHVYVCIYVCMCVCICVCTYVCVYVCMHVCIYVCMFAYINCGTHCLCIRNDTNSVAPVLRFPVFLPTLLASPRNPLYHSILSFQTANLSKFLFCITVSNSISGHKAEKSQTLLGHCKYRISRPMRSAFSLET